MTDEQVLELHGDMLKWATELLVAAQPAIRRSYKNCEYNWVPDGTAERFKRDDDPDELANYQLYKELQQFLEVVGGRQ